MSDDKKITREAVTRKDSDLLPDYVIRTARKKPKSMSDARWRIELRRRKNPEYYAWHGIDV